MVQEPQTVSVDLTFTITAIIAVCSILSPVIVTWMNNQHSIKMRKLEMQSGNRAKAFEQYLLAVGALLDIYSTQSSCNYEACKGLAYLYAPECVWPKMDELDQHIKSRNFDAARAVLGPLCKALSQASKD